MSLSNTPCIVWDVPKLWSATIDAHRREVREAILDTTFDLVERQGLSALNMSQIASATGIGRATLYKYFNDVEAILHAWHEREISRHLERLRASSTEGATGFERLSSALEEFARLRSGSRAHRDTALASLLHRDYRMAEAEHSVRHLLIRLIRDASAEGAVRTDVPAQELAIFCVHALDAAAEVTSRAGTKRMVELVLSALQA